MLPQLLDSGKDYTMQSDHFDHLTEDARKVLNRAREEAQHFQQHYIGAAHLLLGLVHEEQGMAARVLQSQGVSLGEVRKFVVGSIGRGDRRVQGELNLTPRAKRAMELAADEAQRMNQPLIGTEHLLLGLVRAGGIAADVLESLGVNLEQLRTATAQLVSGTTPVSEEGVQQRGRMTRKPIMKAKIVRMILEEE
jgi:ATP-dependent Clp protease ATP-binding subunit ClpC